jgi:uncharacterized protein YyaL (SSP411 family)
MSNRLAGETSPYLLQHKDNPVHWQPWDEVALGEARRRDVPILLSIGYAACHWCHVMEHESFSDPATAEVMNSSFVCIKADREERPDLDSIYMEAVQAMTGQGGWPMTVFLTPDGRPFYGGTYFPPVDRHGLPAFTKVLAAIAGTWRERREEVEEQAGRLAGHLNVGARIRPEGDAIDDSVLDSALQVMRKSFDPVYGGFGGAPKFPQAMVLDLLLRLAAGGREGALDMAQTTLDAMASGGMFDQLAGGFHRYSVDATWTVPHFEKMLYDNALLLRTYARSFLMTGSERHREVAAATAQWMLDEMREPSGGFYSSLDADSEGEEGRFYVWSLEEVREVTGEDYEAAVDRYGFTASGNFEGLNIPIRASGRDDEAVARARTALLARRTNRVRPATDDKVLAAWNAYAAAALAEAGAALGHAGWIEAARAAMTFVLSTMRPDGRLRRSARRGDDGAYALGGKAFCEDHAAVLEAALALFEATGEAGWLAEARWSAGEAMRLFHDDEGGGFFTTGSDAEALVTRPKDVVDNAVPSANSVLALELQRLAMITGDHASEDTALEILRLMRDPMARSPLGFAHLLQALDLYTSKPLEIVVVGDRDDAGTGSLLSAVRMRFLPAKVLVASEESGPLADDLPLLEGRTKVDGRAAAYVCTRGTCRRPVTDPGDLVAEIEAA